VSTSIYKYPLGGSAVVVAGGSSGPGTDGAGILANFGEITGIAFDAVGNLYITDMPNYKIRKLTTGLFVTTVTGAQQGHIDGPLTSARFNPLGGLTIDSSNNIYVSEISGSCTIRKISLSYSLVTTVAGSVGVCDFTDGIGTNIAFNRPLHLALNGTTLFVFDRGESAFHIRRISLSNYGSVSWAVPRVETGIALDTSGNLYAATTAYTIENVGTPATAVVAGSIATAGTAGGYGTNVRFTSLAGVLCRDERILTLDDGAVRLLAVTGWLHPLLVILHDNQFNIYVGAACPTGYYFNMTKAACAASDSGMRVGCFVCFTAMPVLFLCVQAIMSLLVERELSIIVDIQQTG
jgi:hypothetical protein